MSIHSTAIVDPGAELADDVEIHPYAVIGPKVRIGSGTVVGPHAVLDGDTVIGSNNRIFSGAQIGVLSQDLKHQEGLTGRTAIGDGNQFREHVTISASTMTAGDNSDRVTSIGHNGLFMACSHIAHDCHVGDYVILANNSLLSGHVTVQSNAIISGLCAVHQDAVVGTLGYVGGMTRVAKDVPPFMVVEGNPARVVGPNKIGLERNGYSPDAIARIKEMYKITYLRHLNTGQALDSIENSIQDCPERTLFLEFFRRSVRGVIK